MAFANTAASTLVEKDLKMVWHPYTQVGISRPPIPIVRAKGGYLYDEEGRSYLDGISSWWVNLHGHAHPHISAKIKAQVDLLEHVIFADFTHPPAVELASRLLPLLPGSMSRIFYSDNGSTAVETALKMAFQYRYNHDLHTDRTKVVCFRNSYHGDTFGAMSAAGKNAFNKPFWKYLFEVETIDPPTAGNEERSLFQLQTILEKGETSCFIFEPLIQGLGGMIIYPPESLDKLLKLCREHDVLAIADEVMTGFGRTGTMFACNQLQEKPDIICLSKGLTGGFMALGATACTESIYNAFVSERLDHALLHGHSYTGNPIACSSALASMDLLIDPLCDAQRGMIADAHLDFVRRWKNHPKLSRCEALGTILAIEYKAERVSYFDPVRNSLYHHFLDSGVLLRPMGNIIHVMPPYCITRDELDRIYNQIIIAIEKVK